MALAIMPTRLKRPTEDQGGMEGKPCRFEVALHSTTEKSPAREAFLLCGETCISITIDLPDSAIFYNTILDFIIFFLTYNFQSYIIYLH